MRYTAPPSPDKLLQTSSKDDSDRRVTSFVRLHVTEGKYRMVRRILHNAGHSVLELHRTRYGSIELGDLEPGDVRQCSESEKEWGISLLRSSGKSISNNRVKFNDSSADSDF